MTISNFEILTPNLQKLPDVEFHISLPRCWDFQIFGLNFEFTNFDPKFVYSEQLQVANLLFLQTQDG